MPDVRAAEQYQRRVLRLERRYLASLEAAYAELRKELADALNTRGVADLRLVIEQLVTELERVAVIAGRWVADELRGPSLHYARVQLRPLERRRVIINNSIPMAWNQIPAQTEIAIRSLTEPAWTGAVRSRLVTEAQSLAASGVDAAEASARLLSVKVADGRVSAWRAGRNSLALGAQRGLWDAAGSVMLAVYNAVSSINQVEQSVFGHQAIATVDHVTTDCCLRVHGQIQPLDGMFHLTGYPRFADHLLRPPFHWRCRTAIALHHEAMEQVGIPTREMRHAAQSELVARAEEGGREVIWPSHSTSRRSWR